MGEAWKKMRVLHMIDSLHLGGTEKQCYELVRRLDSDDFDTRLITLNKEGALYRKCLDAGITLREFRISGGFCRPTSLFSIIKMASYLRREKVHIVQTYGFYSTFPGILAGVMAHVPVLIAGKRELSGFLSRRQVAAEKLLWRFCDCIVVNAAGVKEHLVDREGIAAKTIEVIPNGVDFEEFTPSSDFGCSHGSIIGMVANFREQKDHETFIQAADLVLKRRPEAKFVCIGGGPRERIMKDYAESLKLGNSILFAGRKEGPELIDWMRRLTITVLASSNEGMPNVLIESMAMAIPAIANLSGGVSEIVVDGVTGYTFPYKRPEILSEKILLLLDDRNLARKMGEAGRQRVEKEFHFDRTVARFRKLYKELYGRKVKHG